MITIEKRVRDMYEVFGTWVGEANRWDGAITIRSDSSISGHGKYFPTKEQAEAYAEKLYQEAK